MSIMTIPNYLSLFRILATPVIIHFLLKGMHTQVFILFSLAVISDGVDGFIARKYHQESKLGKFLDPFSDKCLLLLTFNTLAIIGRIPMWFFLIVFGKELILAACWMSFRYIIREIRVEPDKYGKVASGLLMLLITFIIIENLNLAPLKPLNYMIPSLLLITPFLIGISLFSYVTSGVKQINEYQKKVLGNKPGETADD